MTDNEQECPHCQRVVERGNYCSQCGNGLILQRIAEFKIKRGNKNWCGVVATKYAANPKYHEEHCVRIKAPEPLPLMVNVAIEGFMLGRYEAVDGVLKASEEDILYRLTVASDKTL